MMRFYRALLRLYPAGFRAEYRHELSAAFAERTREFSGPLAPLLIAFAAIADVVPNALAVHWDILRQDLRYAARSLRRTPGFAVTAILVVALGVGANTAAFSLADFVLVRPLAFREPERLVKVWQTTPGYLSLEVSPPNYRDWQGMQKSFVGMGAFFTKSVNLVGTAEPRRLERAAVAPNLLGLLGVPALAGRVITPADSLDGQVAVLSYGLWQTVFGGDTDILGKVVRLDGVPHTVIGVMPASFIFPKRDIALWTPFILREQDFMDRNDNWFEVVARLRDGVSLEQAREEMKVIAARLEQQYPKELKQTGATVRRLQEEVSERARLLVLALCGAALCILLLACANLASLLLARATHRARELAVRAALGAGRERLVRQLVTESIGLAIAGGIVGVAVAIMGVPLLARLVPSTLPIAEQPSIDLRVLVVAVIVVVVTGLTFGVGPAVAAGRSKALDALRDGARAGGGRTQRLRAALVTTEVAASVVLLISSGLLIRAVWRIQGTDPGFRAERVLTLRTALPMPKYDSTARRAQYYSRVLQDVRTLPGVQSAAYVTGLPMSMRGGIWPVAMNGEVLRDGSNSASLRFITPQFFTTLGIPLRGGRDVEDTDTPESPFVAVVSESFAKRYWPTESPIGKRFGFAFNDRIIVGVVGDVRVRGLERESEPQVYLPYKQVADGSLIGYPPKDLVVRSTAPTASLLPAIRHIIAAADPEQPISDVRTMSEVVADDTAPRMTQLRLLAILSGIALLLAGVGIHGLLSFSVSHRTQELGVRRALGEQSGSIVRRVLREGLVLALAGVIIGVALAYPSARAMGALLVGVRPSDPMTIGVAAALCFATAIVGCLRPAIRAARVDPITALRAE
jgi:putative ABC transport system permease protein